MATVDELNARLERLKKARASGFREVEYTGGRRVVYKSETEMASAQTALEQEIAAAHGTRIVRGFRFVSDKAL